MHSNDWPHCFLSSYLKGKGLTFGCDIKDYTIMVGAEPCPTVMLSNNHIACEPPQDRPKLENHSIYGIPRVTVRCVDSIYCVLFDASKALVK